MNINFNLLRKKNGTHILMSITFNGIRIQTTINEKIDEKNWNKKKQRLKGNSTDAFNINSYLMKIENNARDIYYKFKIEGIIPTKNQFKEKKPTHSHPIQAKPSHALSSLRPARGQNTPYEVQSRP